MKRLVATAVFGALTALAFAQAPFTIVRPVDGAKVREVVKVQIPRNAIADNQFVGVFLDGKFLEARVLDVVGKFFEYALDTKERKIGDGTHKLELVLYADMGDAKPRIVDRSSVDVVVANSTSIAVPQKGFTLRYKFRSGYEYPYLIDQRVKVSTITEAQARLGGRAATLDVEGEQMRMLYAIDNAYGNGDGLVRMQPLPTKGKDYAFLTVIGSEGAEKYYANQMHPVYMRVTNTGLETYGSVPIYVPIQGSGGTPPKTDLFASLPLPTLPTKSVRPGDSWQTRFQHGSLDPTRFMTLNSVTQKSLARGEFLGVEWERGHPCAKIKHSISVGANSTLPGMDRVRDGMGRDRVQVEETFWFALDLGMPIKIIEDMQIDTRVADAAPTSGPGAGANTGPAGVSGAGGGQGGGSGSVGGNIHRPGNSDTIRQGRRGGGPGGEDGGPVGGLSGQGGGRLGGNPGQGRQGGPAVGSIRYLRYRIQSIQTLDL